MSIIMAFDFNTWKYHYLSDFSLNIIAITVMMIVTTATFCFKFY